MKTIWIVIRWLIGITLCLASIGGFLSGDIGLAILVFVIGLLFLPAVTKKLFKKKSTQNISDKTTKPSTNKVSNEKIATGNLVKVTSHKSGSNKMEMTIGINEENIVSLLKEKQKQREAEIKNFRYIPTQIQRQGIQLLESINLLNTTKNFDTLIGRYEFISKMYDNFVKASYNKRYISDIQIAIDQYKSLYYDRILKDYELKLLVQPNHDMLIEYYSDCLFNCFDRFYKEQIEQIEALKRKDAKQRRENKIIEIADKTITEFEKNGADNDRFKPLINSIREIIERLDSFEKKPKYSTANLINSTVINPNSTFELTLYNADKKIIEKVIKILNDDNIWNKEKELFPLFTAHNIKCKEIEDYISEYKPQYHKFIEQSKADSTEYQTASEMDKLDIENELKEEAINNLYERAACELDILFEGSEIPVTIDDALIQEYSFETISKYIGLCYKKDKLITNWERKEFEDLLNSDLAISGNDIPNEEILFSQTLKILNKIAEKEDNYFKRKQKAVDYLNDNPELLENIGKYVSTRSIFKLKPLPKRFESVNLETLTNSWGYTKEYIRLLTDTYRDSMRSTDKIEGDRTWIKEFRVEKHESLVPNFICQRAREECEKKYSKNRPPKLPFHVGCNCNLRIEI